jgi:hypothetical protein
MAFFLFSGFSRKLRYGAIWKASLSVFGAIALIALTRPEKFNGISWR